jgi:uncharacterized damage-inducible protein DinB
MSERRTLELRGDDEIGRWTAALEDARGRTLELLERVSEADLDAGEPNTIGSVLYHLAAIEADWLYDEICGDPTLIPADLFPHDVREQDDVLTPIRGMSLGNHLDRLATVRRSLLERAQGLGADAFHALNARAAYDVSPAWVVHHLLQHEAEHRAEIGRALARR